MNSNITEFESPNPPVTEIDKTRTPSLYTQQEVQAWIVNYVADILEMNKNSVDTTVSFDRYGLDSAVAIGLTGDLEDWLGKPVDPTMLYDYPTIEALSKKMTDSDSI